MASINKKKKKSELKNVQNGEEKRLSANDNLFIILNTLYLIILFYIC